MSLPFSKKAVAEEVQYLSELIRADMDDEPEVVAAGARLLTLAVKRIEGSDYLIEFGFDKNRMGRLLSVRESSSEYSEADLTGIWGASGREHNQWIRSLDEDATVYAQYSDDGKTWTTVGSPLNIVVEPEKKTDSVGEYPIDMRDGATLKQMFGKSNVYALNTGSRIEVNDGVMRQRFEPTSTGSVHDQAAARVTSGYSEYTVEMSIKFDKDFTPVLGGKFGFGLIGGNEETVSGGSQNPSGFSATPMFRPSKLPGMIQLVLYTYQTNRSQSLPWGDDNVFGNISRGDWHDLKYTVVPNTSASAKDGIMRLYLDGKLVDEITGVQWQGKGVPGENMRFEYKAFFGGNTAAHAPDSDQTMWLKNVKAYWS